MRFVAVSRFDLWTGWNFTCGALFPEVVTRPLKTLMEELGRCTYSWTAALSITNVTSLSRCFLLHFDTSHSSSMNLVRRLP